MTHKYLDKIVWYNANSNASKMEFDGINDVVRDMSLTAFKM